MAKELEATVGGWTGTIEVPSKISRDDYIATMGALRAEREALYAARNSDIITAEEFQSKTAVISALAAELYVAYADDTLPTVEWEESE